MKEINNVETLVYCLNKSFIIAEQNLRKMTINDKKETYYYISDMVHRLIDCFDRLGRLDGLDNDIVLGLHGLNNLLKHNPSLDFFHWCESDVTTLPILMDGKTSEYIQKWSNIDYVKIKPKYEKNERKKIELYNLYWKDKIVLYTFRYCIKQINYKYMRLDSIPFIDNFILKYTLEEDWKDIFVS